MKKWMLLIGAAMLLAGCANSGREALEEGRERLQEGRYEEARICFERASQAEEDQVAGEAHFELGRLALPARYGTPLALWHFMQARELYGDRGVKGQEMLDALTECQAELGKTLNQERKDNGQSGGSLQVKVDLLEAHARKQSRWLEELRRENALLRRQVSERD